MFRRPPPRSQTPVSFADALTVCIEIGLGKRGSGKWSSREALQNAIDADADSDAAEQILSNEDRFTAKTFWDAAKGRQLPNRRKAGIIKFVTNGEDSEWVGFLESAFDYSASFPKGEHPRVDSTHVNRILRSMRTRLRGAIDFQRDEGMVDYLHVDVETSNKKSRKLVLDKPASLEFLAAGLYYDRELVTGSAAGKLEAFLLRTRNATAPRIFWLDGRSGDGKSTILLQLPEILKHRVEYSFVHIRDHAAFCALDISDTRFLNRRLVLVVDDLAKIISKRASHSDPLAQQLGLFELAIEKGNIKSICIMTCGPTPELEFFRAEFPSLELKNYCVPALQATEFKKFKEWFAFEENLAAVCETDLLVEFLFTLDVGMTLRNFAFSFRQRINAVSGLYREVKKVILASSFELPTPIELFPDERVPIGIERLTADDQRHFYLDSSAHPRHIFFSHNAICRTILRHWVREPISSGTSQQLVEAICQLLSDCRDEMYVFKFTERLRFHPRHAQEICEDIDLKSIDLLDLIRRALPSSSRAKITFAAALATLTASERDTIQARAFLGSISVEDAISLDFKSTSCILIMNIADLARISDDEKSADLIDRCVDILLNDPLRLNAGYALGHLVSRKIAMPDVIEKWMAMNPEGDRPPELICAADRTSATVEEAKRWLQQHGANQQSIKVAAWLIKGALSSDEAMDLLSGWLYQNVGLNGQYSIIAKLLKAYPIDKELFQFSLLWFENNRLIPGAEIVLAQLIRKTPISRGLVAAFCEFVRETVRVHDQNNAARNRIGPPLIAALERWPKNQQLLQKCAIAFINLFSASDHANQVFGQLLKATSKAKRFVDNSELRHCALQLSSSGFNCSFVATHLPTYLKFFDYEKEIVKRAYEWVEAGEFRSNGAGVVTTLLAASSIDDAQADIIWGWISEFSNRKSAHDVLIKYFERFHHDGIRRAEVIEWTFQNRDRFGAAYLWAHIHRHYPEYRAKLGTWNVDRNRAYLDYPKIEQDLLWFQVSSNVETARAVEKQIRSNLDDRSAVNAASALLKSEVDGYDPVPVVLAVIEKNLGNSRPINLITKLARARAIPDHLKPDILSWLYRQRETKGVGVPLLACVRFNVVAIDDCFEWLAASIQNDPSIFGVHLEPLIEQLGESVKIVDIDNAIVCRLADLCQSRFARHRFLARVLAKSPCRFVDLVGEADGPEAISLWATILGWEDAPESVINGFYSWCNQVNSDGGEYQLANLISGSKLPSWLQPEKIDEPTRSLII